MKKKLTPKSIDALRPPERKRYEVRDTVVAGLIIRVSHAGGKVFYLNTRVDGKVKRIRIGPYPVVSLKEARERASLLLRDISLGCFENGGAGSSEDVVPLLGDMIEMFIERYAKPNNRDWRGTERILKKFSSLDQTPIDQIKRKDIARILDQIVADGAPIRANRALAAIKKLMNWCVDRGELEVSPIATMKPPSKENSRERILADEELNAIWDACEVEGFPFEQFTKMLILTAQRRGEVAGMRWSELDLVEGIWTLPSDRAKNATTHTVPLSSLAIDVLSSVPRFLNSDFVFTTTGTTPISGFGRLKRRLDEAVGTDTEDWRLHDIRRTVATNMARLGVAPHVIEAVLNHKSGIVSGVAAVYNLHSYTEEKREALETWADYVEATNSKETLLSAVCRTAMVF